MWAQNGPKEEGDNCAVSVPVGIGTEYISAVSMTKLVSEGTHYLEPQCVLWPEEIEGHTWWQPPCWQLEADRKDAALELGIRVEALFTELLI